MSYKKCKHENNWCDCKKKPCKPEPQVVYYECKGTKPGHNKCCKLVKETEELIEVLEHKNHKLEEELELAEENQALAIDNLDDVKADLAAISTALDHIQSDLNAAFSALNDAIYKVNNSVVPYQANARAAINEAMETQEKMEHIIEELEEAFECTVKCLKNSDSGSACPILVPRESCGCDDEWDDECDDHRKDDCDHRW